MKKRKLKRHYSIMDELMASPTEPLPAEYRRHQLTRMHGGLAALQNADAPTQDDWMVLSDCINLMETLVLDMKICEDTEGLLNEAVKAMAMAGKRSLGGAAIRLDGAGLQAVKSVLSDYGDLIEILPARTMIRCHRLTEKRLHEILQGKRGPHDVTVLG